MRKVFLSIDGVPGEVRAGNYPKTSRKLQFARLQVEM